MIIKPVVLLYVFLSSSLSGATSASEALWKTMLNNDAALEQLVKIRTVQPDYLSSSDEINFARHVFKSKVLGDKSSLRQEVIRFLSDPGLSLATTIFPDAFMIHTTRGTDIKDAAANYLHDVIYMTNVEDIAIEFGLDKAILESLVENNKLLYLFIDQPNLWGVKKPFVVEYLRLHYLLNIGTLPLGEAPLRKAICHSLSDMLKASGAEDAIPIIQVLCETLEGVSILLSKLDPTLNEEENVYSVDVATWLQRLDDVIMKETAGYTTTYVEGTKHGPMDLFYKPALRLAAVEKAKEGTTESPAHAVCNFSLCTGTLTEAVKLVKENTFFVPNLAHAQLLQSEFYLVDKAQDMTDPQVLNARLLKLLTSRTGGKLPPVLKAFYELEYEKTGTSPPLLLFMEAVNKHGMSLIYEPDGIYEKAVEKMDAFFYRDLTASSRGVLGAALRHEIFAKLFPGFDEAAMTDFVPKLTGDLAKDKDLYGRYQFDKEKGLGLDYVAMGTLEELKAFLDIYNVFERRKKGEEWCEKAAGLILDIGRRYGEFYPHIKAADLIPFKYAKSCEGLEALIGKRDPHVQARSLSKVMEPDVSDSSKPEAHQRSNQQPRPNQSQYDQ